MDWSERSGDTEYLDDFSGPSKRLETMLADVDRANQLLGGNTITLNAIRELVKTYKKESYTILDVGCGNGGMLREMANWFRKREIKVSLVGLDINRDAVNIGRVLSRDYPEIEYRSGDILNLPNGFGSFDFVTSTLTMHHFSSNQLEGFISALLRISRKAIIINDLHRSPWAYYSFLGISPFLLNTKEARKDGLTSITRGFKAKELKTLMKGFPSVQHRLRWKWAFRYEWIITKND